MKLLCDFSSTHAGDACSNVGGSDEMDNAAGRFEISSLKNIGSILKANQAKNSMDHIFSTIDSPP